MTGAGSNIFSGRSMADEPLDQRPRRRLFGRRRVDPVGQPSDLSQVTVPESNAPVVALPADDRSPSDQPDVPAMGDSAEDGGAKSVLTAEEPTENEGLGIRHGSAENAAA